MQAVSDMYSGRMAEEILMDLLTILGNVELLDGVTPYELETIANICQERTYENGEMITTQGEPGDELFVICDGFVEVLRSGTSPESSPRTVVNLGQGQLFGEMALVDRGPRSATIRAISENTVVQVIKRDEFDRLCDENHHLGYIVMRNIAADLSFKLRHQHLSGR
jgi:CRP/FNR family cyclic AMP-dependent transcriptional regulator